MDDETKLLLFLLQYDYVKVFECTYTPKQDFSEESMRHANYVADVLRKRSAHRSLYDALDIFSSYAPDLSHSKKGFLFYPDLKAYIRCGDLTPKKLLELFETEDCEKVILFPDASISDTEDVYFTFECILPKETLNELQKKMQEDRMTLILQQTEASNDGIHFPTVPDKSNGTE